MTSDPRRCSQKFWVGWGGTVLNCIIIYFGRSLLFFSFLSRFVPSRPWTGAPYYDNICRRHYIFILIYYSNIFFSLFVQYRLSNLGLSRNFNSNLNSNSRFLLFTISLHTTKLSIFPFVSIIFISSHSSPC